VFGCLGVWMKSVVWHRGFYTDLKSSLEHPSQPLKSGTRSRDYSYKTFSRAYLKVASGLAKELEVQ
jgi:hypothetical protein